MTGICKPGSFGQLRCKLVRQGFTKSPWAGHVQSHTYNSMRVNGAQGLMLTQTMTMFLRREGHSYASLCKFHPMQSKVQEIIQTKEYTNMLENPSALDCYSHCFRRGLLDPSCNMLQHHANIHVFMMSQEYVIHVQHSIHHSKANPVPASLLWWAPFCTGWDCFFRVLHFLRPS